MKRFSRCALILIFVTVIGVVAGFFYENNTITPMYESKTQLYIVPGQENEASIRSADGGLNDDFTIIFKSDVVINDAKKIAGTSENIENYITVKSVPNSNIVEIKCTNPDQTTAKKYVDAVAETALRTTSIIPVKSIQILFEGTQSNVSVKPHLYRNTLFIAVVVFAVCLALEIIIMLFKSAFKPETDNSDDVLEYERKYGKFNSVNNINNTSDIFDELTDEDSLEEDDEIFEENIADEESDNDEDETDVKITDEEKSQNESDAEMEVAVTKEENDTEDDIEVDSRNDIAIENEGNIATENSNEERDTIKSSSEIIGIIKR